MAWRSTLESKFVAAVAFISRNLGTNVADQITTTATTKNAVKMPISSQVKTRVPVTNELSI